MLIGNELSCVGE